MLLNRFRLDDDLHDQRARNDVLMHRFDGKTGERSEHVAIMQRFSGRVNARDQVDAEMRSPNRMSGTKPMFLEGFVLERPPLLKYSATARLRAGPSELRRAALRFR